jgi:phospholipid/cholesterol/gamma-HCH transport system substrate-binding protein
VFVVIAVLFLLAVVGVILVPKLLEHRDIYYIGFRDTSVTGLLEGGTVKYQGLTVGFISHITIDPQDIRRVIVEISLDQGTPIREDTQAEMALLGITGIQAHRMRSGSNEAKPCRRVPSSQPPLHHRSAHQQRGGHCRQGANRDGQPGRDHRSGKPY